LQSLKNADIRCEVDDRSEKIGKKIRDTELARVPYMLVIGEKEVNEGRNFANLRQVFSGMILAVWYKHALKESLLG